MLDTDRILSEDMMAKDESMRRDTMPNLMRFDRLVHKGENPNGFTAQTCNGTAKDFGTGWNKQWNWGGADMQVTPSGPWKAGRSNRTGE